MTHFAQRLWSPNNYLNYTDILNLFSSNKRFEIKRQNRTGVFSGIFAALRCCSGHFTHSRTIKCNVEILSSFLFIYLSILVGF